MVRIIQAFSHSNFRPVDGVCYVRRLMEPVAVVAVGGLACRHCVGKRWVGNRGALGRARERLPYLFSSKGKIGGTLFLVFRRASRADGWLRRRWNKSRGSPGTAKANRGLCAAVRC